MSEITTHIDPEYTRESDDEFRSETYDAAGVDITLVRWFLSLTPAERLDHLQHHVNAILDIRKRNERSGTA